MQKPCQRGEQGCVRQALPRAPTCLPPCSSRPMRLQAVAVSYPAPCGGPPQKRLFFRHPFQCLLLVRGPVHSQCRAPLPGMFTLPHTPGRGNTRPVEALSTQRRAGRAPARPANTCKMQARRGACFYRPSAHGIANERYHKPHGNPIAAMGAFHAFPTRCKTVCGCPWPQKFRRLFFVQPARLQSDDGSAFASRGQPGNLGQATA